MRKLILMMSVSLNGFIKGPEQHIDWHLVDDPAGAGSGGAPAGAPARLEAEHIQREGNHAAVRPGAAKRARHRRIGRRLM
ncbi:hypothetical protein GCM10010193_17980 [Kitasatospora atroaurantiaca]|uniref:RibD domain-containing protein n=1 Tax=Kitasatospora atroaurantiaca TaxID=285545 RepID=A0A561EJT8_9ACTN|nr:hypothetical protein [Kitasatospora atroaurantiaca]TWE15842.1 hypothetical protein FB465_0789 [Kitasatospora atroaurantiaca]